MTSGTSQTATIIPARVRNVTAVLGPTNTGKTHLAIERMLGHETGMIGLPLRLLAREVYDRVAARVGAAQVALVTGEEKIKPDNPRFWVCTVEAMPLDLKLDFVAIDEVQLAADPERGHIFTERLLNMRGAQETLLLGSQTMREPIQQLLGGANFVSRPRLSTLTYAGQKKISRLPRRSAVVAFSASDVYAIAELVRRQRGGAAVVLGALSPRTRNAQVALYQSGDVDFLVATDAVGMGLNLDVDHVAFAGVRKFDGQSHRDLSPGELGQIAGRAGRHLKDGTFGVTGDVEPFSSDLIERLEGHNFEGVKTLQWRNSALEFGSLDALRDSLRMVPGLSMLVRARMADDVAALETLAGRPRIADLASTRDDVVRLWDVCQVPDYRKISSAAHADLVETLYAFVQGPGGRIPEDWFAAQVAGDDRTDGDLDTLSNRLANVRTWTFVSHRSDWLADHDHWQERTREIEDRLSDALHEQLMQRFVDKRTSALMRRLRDDEELFAEIGADGAIEVEKHYVGRLSGLRYVADAAGEGIHGKAARNAAAKVLAGELAMRTRRIAAAKSDAFTLAPDGTVLWMESSIARLGPGDDPLKPTLTLLADEHLSGPDREKVQARLEAWLAELVNERLRPLVQLSNAEDVSGLARGMAFRLREAFGVLKRETVADDARALDQEARAQLRRYGVRFGAFNIFMPMLLKPAATELVRVLWGLRRPGGLEGLPESPRPGLTSLAASPSHPEEFYRIAGFHLCGPRAVRIDMLERLSDMIRPLVAWRRPDEGHDGAKPAPRGATGDGGFVVLPEMMSILGCSSDELGAVLNALGFRMEKRPLASMPGLTLQRTGAGSSRRKGEPDARGTPRGAEGEPVEAANPSDEAAATNQPVSAAIAAALAAQIAVGAPSEPEPPIEAGIAPVDEGQATSDAAPETPQDGSPGALPADADSPAAAEPAGEPQMIDVWRPRRRHAEAHGGRPRQRGQRPARQGASEAAPVAAEANADPNAANRPEAAQARKDHRSRHPRREGAGEGRNRGQGRGQDRGPRADRDAAPGAAAGERGGRPPRDGRPDRGEHRPRRDDRNSRPQVAHASPAPGRRREVDPDSPFAALAKLKAELDAKQKGGRT
ncbi:MAG: helicase [Rhizobiales bacterium]|nr:helicase [Hyphomicrobiales bacterium]